MGKAVKTQLKFDSQELAGKFGLEGTVMDLTVSFDQENGYWVFNLDTYISDKDDPTLPF
jgi:hypothetical protein